MKEKIIVSACLLGCNCKYSGSNNKNDDVISLEKYFDLVSVCPECFGGLPTPREPSEIVGDKVMSKSGDDVTEQFVKGAQDALYIAKECNAQLAILKERSPSCGFGKIYDGTFSGKLCDGNGITADLFDKNEIRVYGENQVKKVIELYCD